MLCYEALAVLPGRYAALRPYTSLDEVVRSLALNPNALDALCLAYRTEPKELSEGAFALLVVALGASLRRLAPFAQEGGEILEALWLAASQPGAPLLLAISRDLANARRDDQRRLARDTKVGNEADLTASPTPSDPWLRRDVMAAVAQLSDEDRQLAALLAAELTQAEIAAKLSTKAKPVTPAVIRKRTQRLRERLRALGVTL